MTEAWRAIDGYPDYEVSDQGRVRRVTSRTCARAGHVLSTKGVRLGYPSVDLCRDGRKRTHLVHRLVAASFLGPAPSARHEVNHVNAKKTDNRAVNLEYVTSSENTLHAYRLGLQDASGEKNGQAKLTNADVAEIRRQAALPNRRSYAAIGAPFSVSGSAVRYIVRGNTWNDDKGLAPRPSAWHVIRFSIEAFTRALTDSAFRERFWSRVDRSGECWLWTGTKFTSGYGVVWVCANSRAYRTGAHRIAYALANHCPLPEMLVLHHCDVRACCRPDHLYAGTYVDNAQDMRKRRRP